MTIRPLDRLLGRITMYRLVLWALVSIAIVAFALSTVAVIVGDGQLFAYQPLELIGSLAVAVLATWGSTVAIARIVGTRANGESAIVTGLILFFLIRPSLDPVSLLAVAAAGILASASKFLIAVRGRHLFNPAAVAAAILTWLSPLTGGLGAAGWWVGTPYLLPIVAIAGLVVLYRVKKLAMAGVFWLVVLATQLPQWVFSYQQDVGAALWYLFAQSPIVFFAAFMLSEPLTLPPRRWQQLLEAAVVGLVFFNLGGFYIGQAPALLVGNLLAFLLAPRLGLRLTFLARRQLTPTTIEYAFRPNHRFAFRPGQYLELEVPHRSDAEGTRRVFSISSAPAGRTDGPRELTVAAKHGEPSSSYKRALLALDEGTVLNARWLGGDFVLPSDPTVKLLLAAGGIGITPFASQLASLGADGARDVAVVYSVRGEEELAYAETLTASGARVLLIAPELPDVLPTGWTYLGPSRLTADAVVGEVPDLADRVAYVSGSPAFVEGVKGALRGRVRGRVRTDHFTGY